MTDTPPPLPQQTPPDHARRHVTEQTRTYPCRQCGAQLLFDPAVQRLKCPSCGGEQDLVENTGQVREHGLERLHAAAPAGVQRFAGGAEKEIVCQNCGGHTTFTGDLTATRCPYCATPIQRDDVHDAPDRLPVDAVLPFRVAEPTAREHIEKWIHSRWFAPSEFTKYSEAGSFRSVYLSYFTFDAAADTSYQGQRGDNRTETYVQDGETKTRTRTDWRPVRGEVHNRFDDVPVLANTGVDESKVHALEPWPTHEAQPYSAEYVAGHLSRTYDRAPEECHRDARTVMQREVDQTVRRDIGGDQQRVHQQDSCWSAEKFTYLLMPVWLLTVVYAGKPFQVCINGVTGEVQGQRPYSRVKIAAAIVLAVLIVVAVVLLLRVAR